MAIINKLFGNEVAQSGPPCTQVWQATHTGEYGATGEHYNYKSYMDRAFISFSYGGKNIEDFNLLATIQGDRLQRDAYGQFEDLTSTYDTINGQFYWGTYFHTNELTFNLATDAITQRELDEFKYWFRAGSIRELILAEHPNRAILARVSVPPKLSLLPFGQEVVVPFESEIDNATFVTNYTTKTTVYRGEIELTFTMDEPFWYAVKNILGEQDVQQGYYKDTWIDANGVEVSVKNSPDALKIIYEDHIPLGSTTAIDVFLGEDTYAVVKYEPWSLIAYEYNEDDPELDKSEWEAQSGDDVPPSNEKYSYSIDNNKYYKGAHIAVQQNKKLYGGQIGGATFVNPEEAADSVELPPASSNKSEPVLYYAGTAPSPIKLRFTLTPTMRQDWYINSPYNKYSDGDKTYNTITLKSVTTHDFKFSLPTIWLSYNQVLEIFDNPNIVQRGAAWLTVRETIRNTIRHPMVRAWANMLINKYDNVETQGIISSDTNLETVRGDLKRGMSMLLKDNDLSPYPASFSFDGKTGLAIGTFTIRDIDKVTISSSTANLDTQILASAQNQENFTKQIEENVGDMVRSSYLILDERNVLNQYYKVSSWSSEHPDYAYLITHDVPNTLTHVHFEFKNLYL